MPRAAVRAQGLAADAGSVPALLPGRALRRHPVRLSRPAAGAAAAALGMPGAHRRHPLYHRDADSSLQLAAGAGEFPRSRAYLLSARPHAEDARTAERE